YLSGTGNTQHCVQKLVHLLDENAMAIPIESSDAVNLLSQHDFIVLGYPVQFSNIPVIVRDFIKNNSDLWKGKKVLCVATMGLFSGDGAGCSARLLKKYGAKVVGGVHILMPDAVCDSKMLKKSLSENREIVKRADLKIEKYATEIKNGNFPKDGLHFYDRIAGCIGQRFWFQGKTKKYTDKLKINNNCIGCGLCVKSCPMQNITLLNNKAIASNRCTMCYRCISLCPKQAITLLGKTVIEQSRYDKYISE
ncbi:MAG: EFR1 family ferrodoxin, partial [Clostridia bacterium]|nr:EFR1 family ferrodoxin [Clostridia bacterium]